MYDQPRPNPAPPAMTFEQMLERVRYEGAYPTRERAEEAVRTVLTALGRQVTGDERLDLAQHLPVEAALTLTAQISDTEQLTGWDFVKDLATRTGGTPATARWDTGAVLSVVTRLAGPDLLARILRRLPDGYALLFGQAELRQPQPAA
ncbi:DUF2267 domain-containing protein [Streptomyces sp. NBC_00503]|uniref:DUF2267 domain-containing protein n=1 Tax=Streptomyces sp. NBC_00503 TaxID=2903659 RepID=UPI002E81C083|nr:DUF2267 domain-containing protein [Streptomyces sp. NBC_00503]WUD81869.1 DUF2267 domain-containing protein [Streptomyces sp. NBC_00503]